MPELVYLRYLEGMNTFEALAAFRSWLRSTSRTRSTINLRTRHLEQLAALFDLDTVTTTQLESILAAMRDLNRASETRKSVLASWRLFFKWAHARGLRADNPTDRIESVKITVRMPRVAPDDQIMLAYQRATLHERGMIALMRFGCFRLSEAAGFRSERRQGDVLRVLGKGDKERIVYANEDLEAALHAIERQQGPGYYFPGLRGPHMHPQSVNKIVTRRTGWNPHSLRHAGATAAFRATGDLRAVQEMLGHASLATTQRYLHLDDDARRRAAAGTAFRIAA